MVSGVGKSTHTPSKPAPAEAKARVDFGAIKKAADVPTQITPGQLDKMDTKDFFTLRHALYTEGWQDLRSNNASFRKLQDNVETRFQGWGGADYERQVMGPPKPAKMDSVDLFKEMSQLSDRQRRIGLGDDQSARLQEVEQELKGRGKAAGFGTFKAWATVLQRGSDD